MIMDTITSMLINEDYVIACFVDILKAFNMVAHDGITSKLINLGLNDEIYNWIVDFISNRQHLTLVNNITSEINNINSSVIQGSVMGPVLFVVAISNLKPLIRSNKYVKYTDDTVIIVPESAESSLDMELQNVKQWALENNLILNTSKTNDYMLISWYVALLLMKA